MGFSKELVSFLCFVSLVSSNFTQNAIKGTSVFSITCKRWEKDYKLSILGNVVKLSDVDLRICKQPPKVIELFAVQSAIIDTDLILIGQEIQVIIIAPTWEVKSSPKNGINPGRRIINLSGLNGGEFKEKQAKSGSNVNKNGAHGLAGRPGGPSGSFYGIANKIINAQQLTIFANGGNGGKGQNGGYGFDGAPGATYNGVPRVICFEGIKGWNYSVIEEKRGWFASKASYKIFGNNGKFGGRGGNGGIGGTSGKKGSITIINLSNNENSIQSAVDGKSGSNGKGGRPGLGGKNGKNVIVSCKKRGYVTLLKADVSKPKETNENTGRARNGLEGVSGISLKMRKFAMNPSPQCFLSSLNQYKMYLRLYLSDLKMTSKDGLWTFYNALGTEESITKMYDTLSLVEQFTGLEKQFFDWNNRMNFTPSYVSLKRQIDSYATNVSKEEDSAEYRNIIKDLQSDIKKRLASVQSLRLYHYVNTNLRDISNSYLLPLTAQLKDFRRTNYILRSLRNKIQLLEENMKSGEKMISDIAQRVIPDMEDTLDQELDYLLKEITEIIEKENDNQVELGKTRQRLQFNLHLKAMFGILKVGCRALGIINPALGFVGAINALAITVIEAKATDDPQAQVAVIPKALEDGTKEFESYLKDLKEKQEKVIKEQEIFVKKVKQSTTAPGVVLIDQVWDAAAKYRNTEEFKNSGYDMMQVYAEKETELKANLENEESKEKNPKKIDALKIGLRVAKYLKATSEVFKTGSESVINIMKNEKKVSEIDEAMKNNFFSLQTLHALEDNIYNQVEPLLVDMKTNLENVELDPRKTNEIQQAVARWNITNVIEEVKRTLNDVTKNFRINEDINWTFTKLIKTFDLVFEMHKILLESKEKQQDKIDETNLHIAHASNLLISNSALRYALSELQLVQLSNQLGRKYHQWMYAFKQKIFPYSGEKLDNLLDLNAFRGKGIITFTDFIIDNMKLIVADFDSDKFEDDRKRVVFKGTHFPDAKFNFSFHIWKNEDNKKALFNILNGKNEKLIADIRDSRFNALKFNRVKILFTVKDFRMQEELNNELDNFDVKLVHHGISKYRYGDTIYEIRNTKTRLEFCYAANSTERETNRVSRLARGPYLLSPYATWSIQLIPIRKVYNFKLLQKFAEIVDLELIGNAEYSEYLECDSICQSAMKKCYTVADDFS